MIRITVVFLKLNFRDQYHRLTLFFHERQIVKESTEVPWSR